MTFRMRYLLFAALFVGGALARAYYHHDWPLHDLAHALFDAIAVAGVLGAVIELAAQKRLIYEVATELSGRIAGRHLPKSLQHALDGIVTGSDLVMRNYVRVYRFSDHAEAGYYVVDSTTSYEVWNYAPRPKGYTPRMSEEVIHEPTFLRLAYGRSDKQEREFMGDQLQALVALGNGGRAREVVGPTQVRIPSARDTDHPVVCRVTYHMQAKMRTEYTDVTAVGRACDGMRIRAEDVPPNLEFLVGGLDAEQTDTHEWKTNRGMINGQHLRCWWYLKRLPRMLG